LIRPRPGASPSGQFKRARGDVPRAPQPECAPAAQHEAGVPPDAQPMRDYSAAQHVGRGDQGFSGDLAMLAKPGSDVHRVAEIRDLPLRDAALADDDGTRMNTGAAPRHDAEFPGIRRSEFDDPFFDGEEAAQ